MTGRPENDLDDEDREFEAAIGESLSRINATTHLTPTALANAISSGYNPPLVSPGRLRPYVPHSDPWTGSSEFTDVLARAVNLLLLAHEVIIDDPGFWMGFELGVGPAQIDVGETDRIVRALVDVWDLVEDGSLHMGDMNIHPMWDAQLGREEASGLGFTEEDFDHWGYQEMA